ncbi:hypothetical protein ACXHMN_11020 [Rhizobium sp. LEGMi12c]
MKTLLSVIFLTSISAFNIAQAQDAGQCQALINGLKDETSAVTSKYRPQLDQLSKDASIKAQQIKDDAPNPSAAGAVLKFDIKVTTHDQEFIFGTPSATMKTQSVKLDLPEVSSHRVEWSWDLPEFGSHMECVNGIPETVCDFGKFPPSCSLRAGPQICTKVPDVTMKTQSASMDVPDVAMRTQEIKFDLPEFFMEQQRIVLTIPDFTLVNVSAEMDKTQQDSEQLKEDTQRASDTITGQMKAELKTVTASKLAGVFGCYENSIISQRDKSLLDIDNNIASFKTKAATARDQKNDAVAKSIDASLATLVTMRAQIVTQFDIALSELHKKRDDALNANTAL